MTVTTLHANAAAGQPPAPDRLGIVGSFAEIARILAGDPGGYDAIADGPGLEILADLGTFALTLARGLHRRDTAAARATDGLKVDSPAAETPVGRRLDWLLEAADAAVHLWETWDCDQTGRVMADPDLATGTACTHHDEAAAVLRTTVNGLRHAQLHAELALHDMDPDPEPPPANVLAALLRARPDLARAHRDRILGPVLDIGDPCTRRELLDTLDAWLDSGSAVLFCHRNTVLNRIRRVERLTRRSLSTPGDLVDLALALEAHHMLAPDGGREMAAHVYTCPQ